MITGSRAVEVLTGPSTLVRKIVDPLDGDGIVVPVHYVSDGASIPRAFWTLIGHPFEGRFLRPALIHDIRCEMHVGTWQNTHSQFLDNLRLEGVSAARSRAMFAAVWTFGPRWPWYFRITPDDLREIMSRRLGPNGRAWGHFSPTP